MMLIEFFLLPLVGGLIGWITNILAVKMLFWPYEPVKLLGLPWKIQGLIPGRRDELAKKIGEVVEEQLLSQEDLIAKLKNDALQQHLIRSFAELVTVRLQERIPPIIPSSIRQLIGDLVSEQIKKEFLRIIDDMVEQTAKTIKSHVPIGNMVEERVRSFDLLELENLILKIAQKELKHIEWLGGLLGMLIGLLQSILLWLLRSF